MKKDVDSIHHYMAYTLNNKRGSCSLCSLYSPNFLIKLASLNQFSQANE